MTLCIDRDIAPLPTAVSKAIFTSVSEHPRTLAACLMPDHLHWLLNGGPDSLQQVSAFKSWTTRLSWRHGVRGRLWQRSFHDRVARSNDALHEIARYIINNPVRANLVSEARDYPYQYIAYDRTPQR